MEKDEAKALLAEGTRRLSDLQERLYAQDRWAVLAIFQAMDAAGKDGAIKHVMSGVNPQGVQVSSFKAPSPQELDHDFMWRTTVHLPERGRIGIFNRSYYEEVLVVRVHREYLERQKLPPELVTKHIWKERFEDIAAFERYLARNGTLILKFFLHVSKEEQRKRFLERLDEPAKRWKFSMGDVAERKLWDDYMDAYQDLIRHTSAEHAPWYVIPGRQQVVRAAHGGGGHDRGDGTDRPRVPQGGEGRARRADGGAQGAAGGGEAAPEKLTTPATGEIHSCRGRANSVDRGGGVRALTLS